MAKKEEVYQEALIGKNIPILTLDNKWHKLFTQTGVSPKIKKKEAELNKLLKRQGKLNTDIRDIKKLKAKLMQDIVSLMGDAGEAPKADSAKKQDENKRLVEECNEKVEQYQDEMFDLEHDIRSVNHELMLLSMEVCYDVIANNTKEIEEIDKWINQMRIDLKKNIVRKQERTLYNQEMYSYMHDIFGPDVIGLFDMKYNPEEMMLKKDAHPGTEKKS